jgi:lipoprotein-anchoring transpeptidase ErfK/SrfK|uniref:Murein L,D-transpeptidase n=1 Tax=Desulfobacca acetoxidans TaxID=60893 RepID=A0A7V6DPT1_9BACT
MLRHIYHPGKNWGLVLLAAWMLQVGVPAACAWDLFKEYDKVIFINQPRQIGAAYEDGRKLREFPVLTGDDECPTDPGLYVISQKDPDYYSRTYDTPMPYSLFFDWPRRKAIHEGGVPGRAEKRELATHGCIHVEQPDIEWLYHWAEEGATAVVISGERSAD